MGDYWTPEEQSRLCVCLSPPTTVGPWWLQEKETPFATLLEEAARGVMAAKETGVPVLSQSITVSLVGQQQGKQILQCLVTCINLQSLRPAF